MIKTCRVNCAPAFLLTKLPFQLQAYANKINRILCGWPIEADQEPVDRHICTYTVSVIHYVVRLHLPVVHINSPEVHINLPNFACTSLQCMVHMYLPVVQSSLTS